MDESIQDAVTAAAAAFDQFVAACRPAHRCMVFYQQACIDAGLSPAVADALTLRLAGWLLPVPDAPPA